MIPKEKTLILFRKFKYHKKFISQSSLLFYLNYIFKFKDLCNKNVLDIGGGSGLITLYASLQGAQAVCLEPESSGSTKQTKKQFNKIRKALEIRSIKANFLRCKFQDFNTARRFDLVCLIDSINHLDEESVIRLKEDTQAQKKYIKILKKVYSLMKKNGTLIITDCSRNNFFNDLRIPSPFRKSIEWHKHHSPFLWVNLLKAVGFKKVSLNWTTPSSIGKLGRILFGNKIAAYFFLSHFRLELKK